MNYSIMTLGHYEDVTYTISEAHTPKNPSLPLHPATTCFPSIYTLSPDL